jgi:photosystem II stability/assembly factor-like uncharacterized protein
VWGSGPGNVVAVGTGGTVLHYDGNTWTAMEQIYGAPYLSAVWGSGPEDIFAVGENGTVLHYNGRSWQAMDNVPTDAHLSAVWGSGPGNVFAVGSGGMVLHYDGQSWKAMKEIPIGAYASGAWESGPADIHAVDDGGTVLIGTGPARSYVETPDDAAMAPSRTSGKSHARHLPAEESDVDDGIKRVPTRRVVAHARDDELMDDVPLAAPGGIATRQRARAQE